MCRCVVVCSSTVYSVSGRVSHTCTTGRCEPDQRCTGGGRERGNTDGCVLFAHTWTGASSPAWTPSPTSTGYEALAEAPGPTTLPPQSSEDVVSSGPEDCGFFPNGAFDHCLSHIPSIYTDT